MQAEAGRRPGARITKVGVKIGELAGVDVDALQFGSEAIIKDTDWEDWHWRSSRFHEYNVGRKCANEFRTDGYDPECPQCGEFATQCFSGEELDIAYTENAGNLVCPSSYDLGEDAKIVLLKLLKARTSRWSIRPSSSSRN